jgi:plasmid stability protein
MATLTIRNLPSQVLQALRKLAKSNGRSVEDQVRRLLAETAVDRLSACDLIEGSWQRQSRAATADEVDAWLDQSRP